MNLIQIMEDIFQVQYDIHRSEAFQKTLKLDKKWIIDNQEQQKWS